MEKPDFIGFFGNEVRRGTIQMDWFLSDVLFGLLAIVIIDLVLAGDNAIVIGMAARNLPARQQKQAIIWGTVGAVVVRVLATLVVLWLFAIPGLKLAGGLVLVWIAYKLTIGKKDHNDIRAQSNLWKAIGTIIVADAAMGLDNVLAVAAAAHGNFLLVIFGLAISIPVMVFCSTLVIKLLDRFPWTVYVGSGVLAWTAGKMIVDEHFIAEFVAGTPMLKWGLVVIVTAAVLAAGIAVNQRRTQLDNAPLNQQQE